MECKGSEGAQTLLIDQLKYIMFLILLGHVEVVKILLENDADIGCKDRHHFTPLHAASASGQVSVVKVLLDHGAKVSIKLHILSSTAGHVF